MTELLDNDPINNKPKQSSNSILTANAIIFAAYTLVALGMGRQSFFIVHAICIVVHVGLLFLIGIIAGFTSKRDTTKYYLLSAGLVLLIGFGSCIGLANLME